MKNILLIIAFIFTFSTLIKAQENVAMLNKKSSIQDIKVRLKENSDQAFYIDGKKYNSNIFNLLDFDKVETITVLKGEEAIKKYGEPNVVIITTKKDFVINNIKFSMNDSVEQSKTKPEKYYTIKLDEPKKGQARPIIIIDGKVSDIKTMNNLTEGNISNIKILQDEKTKKKYNTEVGVIFVITNEGKESGTTIEYSDDDTSKKTSKGYFSFINEKGAAKKLLRSITDDIDKIFKPVIIVNGEIKDEAYLEKLNPDAIRGIKVFADQKSIEKYNTKYGVIVIKLKGL